MNTQILHRLVVVLRRRGYAPATVFTCLHVNTFTLFRKPGILNHLNTDSGRTSVLVLLDLSAAFDTVDNILLDRLENWVGLSATVLNWFESYLKDRKKRCFYR